MADDNVIKGKFYPRGERVIKGKGKEVFAQIKAEREAYERAHGITSEEKKTSMRKKKPGDIRKKKPGDIRTKKPGNMKKAPSLDDLTKTAKQALVKNPGMGKTALKRLLSARNAKQALIFTAITLAYDYFKNNKGEGKTPSASERKAARHGEGMQSLKDQALKASKPPKKKKSTRKKAALRQGRGMAHGGPVKSKYTTTNKRYSNGGKIYPR